MKSSTQVIWRTVTVLVITAMLLTACAQAPAATAAPADKAASAATGSLGLIGSADRAKQEYVWISNFSSLPLFVDRVYPSLDAFARDFGVVVRKAGPTQDDLASYIATVETECARKPAGVIVVGGWDQSLQEPVNKCLEQKVPVVVTDGDLPNSNRLSYVGTNWYNLGVTFANFQIKEHEARGLKTGKIAILSPIQAQNMQEARQGIKDTLKGTGIEVVAEEDNESNASVSAQKMAAILAANKDLTGVVGLDSESPPGIVTALDEAGLGGKLVVTTNEGGLEFFKNIKEGKVQLIVMEKYDVMEYLALTMLYMFHNESIRPAGLDPWKSNWMPNKIDSGLIMVTKDTVDEVMTYYEKAQQKK
ncbi:MAG: substrate-binding domain-containing protein [Leptolinea sp.]|jgi:ABC-type sugar transport system substrate-binding protein|nr:substrate-binding domain-containing protein [Leptolinea sp.]